MIINKNSINIWSIVFLMVLLIVSCKNEKPERKLIGQWDLVNSKLSLLDSNTLVHETDYVGIVYLERNKIDKSLIDLNKGRWEFQNFPDTIIPSSGDLSWTSTEKGDFKKIPWKMDIYFSKDYVKDYPVQGSYYFDCYQGQFNVTELKKKEHYRINGYIYKPNMPYYSWVFELKER
jgi:hypothetical protein